jgi:hypothetical protein
VLRAFAHVAGAIQSQIGSRPLVQEGFAQRGVSTAQIKEVGASDSAKQCQSGGHFERGIGILRTLAMLQIGLKDGRIVVELWTFVAHNTLCFLTAVVGKSI